jgi:hypothetical protein
VPEAVAGSTTTIPANVLLLRLTCVVPYCIPCCIVCSYPYIRKCAFDVGDYGETVRLDCIHGVLSRCL